MQEFVSLGPYYFFSGKFKTELLMLFDLTTAKITMIDKYDRFLRLVSDFFGQIPVFEALFYKFKIKLKTLDLFDPQQPQICFQTIESLYFQQLDSQLQALALSRIHCDVYLFDFFFQRLRRSKVSNSFSLLIMRQKVLISNTSRYFYIISTNFYLFSNWTFKLLIISLNIMITQHQAIIKIMQNQNTFGFYYVPLAQNSIMGGGAIFFNPELYQEMFIQEQYRLIMEKNSLISTLSECNVEKERFKVQNTQLKEEVSKSDPKIKRRYRERRTWLEKKFRCNIKGCRGKYSSKIALNSHKRRKHPKKPKQ